MKKSLIVLLVFSGGLLQVRASDYLGDDYVMVYTPEQQAQIDQQQKNITTAVDAVKAFQEEVKQECGKNCWWSFLSGNGKKCCGEIAYNNLRQKWIEISEPVRPVGGFPDKSYGRIIDIAFDLI